MCDLYITTYWASSVCHKYPNSRKFIYNFLNSKVINSSLLQLETMGKTQWSFVYLFHFTIFKYISRLELII